jgi:hypothetical protein
MPETLPALTGDPDVLLAAIARAAAKLAAKEQCERQTAEPLTREAIEAIVEECVHAAFLRFGVDLSKLESVEDHRETIAHARRSRKWWDKAGMTIVGGLAASILTGLITLVVKFVAGGGVK